MSLILAEKYQPLSIQYLDKNRELGAKSWAKYLNPLASAARGLCW
jgi:hypothetical protein